MDLSSTLDRNTLSKYSVACSSERRVEDHDPLFERALRRGPAGLAKVTVLGAVD